MDPIDLFARSPVIGAVILSALLFFALLGATKLWPRDRTPKPPEESGTRFTSAPDLAIVLIGLLLLLLVGRLVMRLVA